MIDPEIERRDLDRLSNVLQCVNVVHGTRVIAVVSLTGELHASLNKVFMPSGETWRLNLKFTDNSVDSRSSDTQ
jgi:hypothetical protein